MTKKGLIPQTKKKNAEPENTQSIDWILWAAWADRITFEEIYRKTGKTEKDVISIMRSNLRPNSYKLWRKRVRQKSIKHQKLFKYKRQAFSNKNLSKDY